MQAASRLAGQSSLGIAAVNCDNFKGMFIYSIRNDPSVKFESFYHFHDQVEVSSFSMYISGYGMHLAFFISN